MNPVLRSRESSVHHGYICPKDRPPTPWGMLRGGTVTDEWADVLTFLAHWSPGEPRNAEERQREPKRAQERHSPWCGWLFQCTTAIKSAICTMLRVPCSMVRMTIKNVFGDKCVIGALVRVPCSRVRMAIFNVERARKVPCVLWCGWPYLMVWIAMFCGSDGHLHSPIVIHVLHFSSGADAMFQGVRMLSHCKGNTKNPRAVVRICSLHVPFHISCFRISRFFLRFLFAYRFTLFHFCLKTMS